MNKITMMKDIYRKKRVQFVLDTVKSMIPELTKDIAQNLAKQTVEQLNHKSLEIHKGVKCDGCSKFPLVGLRYKCSICLDFDYCEECESTLDHSHAFIKFKTESQAWDYYRQRRQRHRAAFQKPSSTWENEYKKEDKMEDKVEDKQIGVCATPELMEKLISSELNDLQNQELILNNQIQGIIKNENFAQEICGIKKDDNVTLMGETNIQYGKNVQVTAEEIKLNVTEQYQLTVKKNIETFFDDIEIILSTHQQDKLNQLCYLLRVSPFNHQVQETFLKLQDVPIELMVDLLIDQPQLASWQKQMN